MLLHPAVKYSVYRITGTVPKLFFLIFTVFLQFPGVFLGLGLSGVIPTLHYVISEGFLKAATIGQIGWLMLMASLYITGAALYAARIPERFFPGKCDIWVSMVRGGQCLSVHLLVGYWQTGKWNS